MNLSVSLSLRAVKVAALASLALALGALTGCSDNINTMHGPTTPTRMGHFGAYPIDDPSPTAGSHAPPMVARGYGIIAG